MEAVVMAWLGLLTGLKVNVMAVLAGMAPVEVKLTYELLMMVHEDSAATSEEQLPLVARDTVEGNRTPI